MQKHLLLGPIDKFAEAIQILKQGNVTDGLCLGSLIRIRVPSCRKFLGERVVVCELTLFDFENVDVLVEAGANGELNISLVAEHELRFHFGGGYPLALFVLDDVAVLVSQPNGFSVRSLYLAFKRYKVELTKLRGGGKVKALTEQRAGENGTCITLLECRIYCNGRRDCCDKALRSLGVAEGVVYQILIRLCRDRHRKLCLLGHITLGHIHILRSQEILLML